MKVTSVFSVDSPFLENHSSEIKNLICATQNEGQIIGTFPFFPEAFDLATLFHQICHLYWKKIAVLFFKPKGDLIHFTYKEMFKYIVSFASGLKVLGFEKQHPLICFAENSERSFFSEWATYYCGGIFIPISDHSQNVHEIIKKYQPTIFICSSFNLSKALDILTSIKKCSVKNVVSIGSSEKDLPSNDSFSFKLYTIRNVEHLGKTKGFQPPLIKASDIAAIFIDESTNESFSFTHSSFISASSGLYGTGIQFKNEMFSSISSLQNSMLHVIELTVLAGGGTIYIPPKPMIMDIPSIINFQDDSQASGNQSPVSERKIKLTHETTDNQNKNEQKLNDKEPVQQISPRINENKEIDEKKKKEHHNVVEDKLKENDKKDKEKESDKKEKETPHKKEKNKENDKKDKETPDKKENSPKKEEQNDDNKEKPETTKKSRRRKNSLKVSEFKLPEEDINDKPQEQTPQPPDNDEKSPVENKELKKETENPEKQTNKDPEKKEKQQDDEMDYEEDFPLSPSYYEEYGDIRLPPINRKEIEPTEEKQNNTNRKSSKVRFHLNDFQNDSPSKGHEMQKTKQEVRRDYIMSRAYSEEEKYKKILECMESFNIIKPTCLYLENHLFSFLVSSLIHSIKKKSFLKRFILDFFLGVLSEKVREDSLLSENSHGQNLEENELLTGPFLFAKAVVHSFLCPSFGNLKYVFVKGPPLDKLNLFIMENLTNAKIYSLIDHKHFIGPILVQYKSSIGLVPSASLSIRLKYKKSQKHRQNQPPKGKILVSGGTFTANPELSKHNEWGYDTGYIGFLNEDSSITLV